MAFGATERHSQCIPTVTHISVGKHYSGSTFDVLVSELLVQFWVGNELLQT